MSGDTCHGYNRREGEGCQRDITGLRCILIRRLLDQDLELLQIAGMDGRKMSANRIQCIQICKMSSIHREQLFRKVKLFNQNMRGDRVRWTFF
jgi:hypothetical protein